jgi:hypothetical protein
VPETKNIREIRPEGIYFGKTRMKKSFSKLRINKE